MQITLKLHLIGSFLCSSLLFCDINVDKAKAFFNICAMGGGLALSKAAEKSEPVKKLANKTGTSEQDISNIIGTTASLALMGFIAGGTEKAGYLALAAAVPVAGISAALATSKPAQEVARLTYVLGDRVVCNNEKCEGICTNCRATKGLLMIGLYCSTVALVNFLLTPK